MEIVKLAVIVLAVFAGIAGVIGLSVWSDIRKANRKRNNGAPGRDAAARHAIHFDPGGHGDGGGGECGGGGGD